MFLHSAGKLCSELISNCMNYLSKTFHFRPSSIFDMDTPERN
jgi:hypothetical protein